MGNALWEDPVVNLMIWTAVLAVLVTCGAYVLARLRAETVKKERTASELMSKCREMYSRGGLTDEEFRTIKTHLSARLQDELREDGRPG